MAAPQQRPGEPISGINVTPLVDVVLVLLILVMVSASHAVSRAIPIHLPRANSGESSKSAPLAIDIAADGTLHLDGKGLSYAQLRQHLRGAVGPETSALIAADGAARHQSVVRVIDLLRTAGVTQLAFNVSPAELEPIAPELEATP
jgi:biopolymer transport protein ExbD